MRRTLRMVGVAAAAMSLTGAAAAPAQAQSVFVDDGAGAVFGNPQVLWGGGTSNAMKIRVEPLRANVWTGGNQAQMFKYEVEANVRCPPPWSSAWANFSDYGHRNPGGGGINGDASGSVVTPPVAKLKVLGSANISCRTASGTHRCYCAYVAEATIVAPTPTSVTPDVTGDGTEYVMVESEGSSNTGTFVWGRPGAEATLPVAFAGGHGSIFQTLFVSH